MCLCVPREGGRDSGSLGSYLVPAGNAARCKVKSIIKAAVKAETQGSQYTVSPKLYALSKQTVY